MAIWHALSGDDQAELFGHHLKHTGYSGMKAYVVELDSSLSVRPMAFKRRSLAGIALTPEVC